MDLLLLVVQLALAGGAFWYAWETRRHRLGNDAGVALLRDQVGLLREQIEAMRKQARSAIIPALLLSVSLPSSIEETYKYRALVDNMSTRIGRDAWVYLYDAGTKSYLVSDDGYEVLAPNTDDIDFTLSQGYVTKDELSGMVRRQYGDMFDDNLENFDPLNHSFVCLAFRDVAGEGILMRRNFSVDEGKVAYHDGWTTFSREN